MIKLGIIGLSEGNGHPYSWSAIFNGYDNKLIKNCPFPAIPEYLNMQIWPNACISNAKVVSILTQDFNLSKNIAEMTYIPYISENIAEMINKVDAILLARDDAENHIYYAEPTIMANKAIYIDKPIALNMNQFDKIYSLERYYGQIFTCSALRYSKEMELSNEDFKELGEIKKINAYTPKSWNKYAVHIIEPVYKILLKLNHTIPTFSKLEDIGNGGTRLSVIWNEKIETIFTTLGNLNSDIYIEIFGINGIKILTFKDSFTAFKYSLENFIEGVYLKQCNSPKEFNKKIVQIIELGGNLSNYFPTIMITGATGKLGSKFINHFLNKEWNVVAVSRNIKKLEKLSLCFKDHKNFIGINVDLMKPDASKVLLDKITEKGIRVDHLVNNARSIKSLKVEKDGWTSRDNLEQEYLLDVIVPYELSKAFSTSKYHNLSSITNIGSIYGLVAPNPNLYLDPIFSPIQYSLAKAALNHLTKELAVRLAPKKIRVNGLVLGGVEGRVDKEFVERYSKLTPINRMLNENDVIPPIDFLVSTEGQAITGHLLIVDGGWTIW